MKMPWNEDRLCAGLCKLKGRLRHDGTPLALSFNEVINRHLIKQFGLNKFARLVVQKFDENSHKTINSAFSFCPSSKKSFPPCAKRASTS